MRIIKNRVLLLASLIVVSGASAINPPTLERAKELYYDGRWIDSRLSLLNFREANPSYNPEVDYYLAMCAVELDDPEVEVYLSEYERLYPSSSHINNIYFARALFYTTNERYSEAKEAFSLVNYSALSTAEREKYNMRMGYILFVEGKYDEAKKYLSAISPESPIYHHALYYNSYIDYNQGDNASSKDGFTKLMESDAYLAIVPFYLLQIEFNDGRYNQVLEQGIELYPVATLNRQIELSRTMAEAAFRLERYTDAIAHMNGYKDKGGEMGREESYILGFSLYREVCYSEAVDYLRAACGADDEITQNSSYHLADCYLRLGDKSSASKSFAMAANESFNAQIAEDALFNYAKLQYELGDDRFNETINVLTRYINQYSKSSRYDEAKELLIAAYYNSREYDAAYKAIKEVENPDSDIRLALQRIALYRGLDNFNSGNYSEATANIKESLSVNISPKYSSLARFWLGEIEFIAGNYQAALDNYNSYLVNAPKSDENYALALYNIAYAKLMMDSVDEAMGYYSRFVEMVPSDTFYRADGFNRIGDIFYGRRQFSNAHDNYKRATWSKFEPRHYALYQTAIIEGIQGEYAEKVKRLKAIISLGEGDYVESATYELGRSYIAAGDYKSGVTAHELFVKKYPSSDKYAQALSDLGLAYLNLSDKSASINYYDKAIKAAPQSSVAKDALQGIREIYINDGNADGYFKYAASVGHSGDIDDMTRDSLSFASAQRLYISSEGRSTTAIQSLSEYVKSYPQGYYTTDALFFLSDSYMKMGQNDDAIASLTQLSKRGVNQYSERLYDNLSRLTFDKALYSQAAVAYKELYSITQKSDVSTRALTGYLDATLLAKDNDATLQMVDFVVKQNDISPQLLVKANHAKAKILLELGDTQLAIKIFSELSEDTTSYEGAESMYILIKDSFTRGDLDLTEEKIFAFSESNTPQSYWLARSFILLGDIYTLREDYFQARATYQSIIDGYALSDDGIVEQAKANIEKLP